MSNYSMPYGYQFQPQPPQYPQYPYDPRLEKLQALDTRMAEMEARLYGNSARQTHESSHPQSYTGYGGGGNNQSNRQEHTIITVQSEDEAFRDPPNIDGSKQIYTDGKNGGLPTYAKWFDANIPKTFRKKAVWVDIGDETVEQPAKVNAESDITPAITSLSEKVAAMEESIGNMMDEFDEIMAYVRKLTVSAKRNKNGQFVKKEDSVDVE